MSKRRINKQQSARIKKIQNDYHKLKNEEDTAIAEGLVISRFSKQVEIEAPNGQRIVCSIRPNLDTVVAGDRVIWQPEGDNQGVVVSIYPRKTILARPTTQGRFKAVAANITQLIIVIAPVPEISWPLLDSYLIVAKLLQLKALIVLNKTDLEHEHIKKQLVEHYMPLHYSIVFCHLGNLSSFDSLGGLLQNEVSVFVGQSGVGKSSLIAHMLPDEQEIHTSALSLSSQLGRHTTSNSKYYHLNQGGGIIDSPGVREFSLWHVEPEQIAQCYSEFSPYLSLCKFRNCTHIQTPQCAIINALSQGKISRLRYENYIKLRAQYCNNK